jgi:hypothetical protein
MVPLFFQADKRIKTDFVFFGGGLGAGPVVAYLRAESFGAPLAGSSYGAAADVHLETGVAFPWGETVFSLRYMLVYLAGFSNATHIDGNAGGAVADLGYRFVW